MVGHAFQSWRGRAAARLVVIPGTAYERAQVWAQPDDRILGALSLRASPCGVPTRPLEFGRRDDADQPRRTDNLYARAHIYLLLQ